MAPELAKRKLHAPSISLCGALSKLMPSMPKSINVHVIGSGTARATKVVAHFIVPAQLHTKHTDKLNAHFDMNNFATDNLRSA